MPQGGWRGSQSLVEPGVSRSTAVATNSGGTAAQSALHQNSHSSITHILPWTLLPHAQAGSFKHLQYIKMCLPACAVQIAPSPLQQGPIEAVPSLPDLPPTGKNRSPQSGLPARDANTAGTPVAIDHVLMQMKMLPPILGAV